MSLQKFMTLSAEDRALVAFAVLMDGRDGAAYLENDSENGETLKAVVLQVTELDPETRVPAVATLLRSALAELDQRS